MPAIRVRIIVLVLVTVASVLALASPALAAPPNDLFDAAQPIAGLSGSVLGTNVDATGETGEPSHAESPGPIESVWYRWTAPSDGTFFFHTCSREGDYDTTLAAYTGPAVDGLLLVAQNDSASNLFGEQCRFLLNLSAIRFEAVAGAVYSIAVDGGEEATGAFRLTWGPPQGTDDFPGETLTGDAGSVMGSNVDATSQFDEPVQGSGLSIWFTWIAAGSGPARFDLCGATFFDTVIAVYTGDTLAGLIQVVSADDTPGCTDASSVEFDAVGGTTYRISVDSVGSDGGFFSLAWTHAACTITGTAAVDNITGTKGNDVICGKGGNDSLAGHRGNDWIAGGAGNDTLAGQGGDDVLDGGEGIDTGTWQDSGVTGVVQVDLETGTAQNAVLGSDTLALVGLFSTIENVTGSPGNDAITGDENANFVNSKGGNDLVRGNGGNDTLAGNTGDDDLGGGAGHDLVQPGPGSDVVSGGIGFDLLKYNDALSGVTVDLFNNATGGGASGDVIALADFEGLTGSPFDDILTADSPTVGSNVNGILGNDTIDVADDNAGPVDEANGGPGTDTCDVDPNDQEICEI